MNPVLAGLGMLAAAMKFGAADEWGIKPLTRFPDDLELGEQFYSRVRKAEDFQFDMAMLFNYPVFDSDHSTKEEEDDQFVAGGGCTSKKRRNARITADHIAEVRGVTRHSDWNPFKAKVAWVTNCENAGSRGEYCEEQWHEADVEWDSIIDDHMMFVKFERRNCPALIGGLRKKRLR